MVNNATTVVPATLVPVPGAPGYPGAPGTASAPGAPGAGVTPDLVPAGATAARPSAAEYTGGASSMKMGALAGAMGIMGLVFAEL